MNDLVSITLACIECGESHTIQAKSFDFIRWEKGEENIQNIFPYLSTDDREMMISNICPKCFDKFFGGKEDG